METTNQTAIQAYTINGKNFVLKNDFTFEELEWLDVVMDKLQVGNEIKGEFTKEEIEKTLSVVLSQSKHDDTLRQVQSDNDFTHKDFMNCTTGMSIKIIADFFLLNAVRGLIIKSCSMN